MNEFLFDLALAVVAFLGLVSPIFWYKNSKRAEKLNQEALYLEESNLAQRNEIRSLRGDEPLRLQVSENGNLNDTTVKIKKIKNYLKRNPKSKAREIARSLHFAKREINQVLYDNPEMFVKDEAAHTWTAVLTEAS